MCYKTMTYAAPFVATVAAIAGISIAVASLHGPDRNKPAKKDPVAAAIDTLEHQLQRRFHDRNNVTFGYERVTRPGSRRHNTTVADLWAKRGEMLNDEGKPMATRQTDHGIEYEVSAGVWLGPRQIKELMHAENEDEKSLMAVLRDKPVAIYTAGAFDIQTGLPLRIKGPAYLRYNTPDGPDKKGLGDLAVKGWASRNDADEMRKDGWSFRVVKVKADDESCVQCHSDQRAWGDAAKHTVKPYKMGDAIGIFIIATKPK
jgi:hypothetical protein